MDPAPYSSMEDGHVSHHFSTTRNDPHLRHGAHNSQVVFPHSSLPPFVESIPTFLPSIGYCGELEICNQSFAICNAYQQMIDSFEICND